MFVLEIALLSAMAAPPGPSPFVERDGWVAFVATSTGAESVLARAIQTEVEGHTSLHVIGGDELGVRTADLRAAGGRFGAWLDAVPSGGVRPVDFLVVGSVLVDPAGPDRVALALMDITLARRADEYAAERGADAPARDAQIFRDAVFSQTSAADSEDPASVRDAVSRFVAKLRPALIKARRWAPNGKLAVVTEAETPVDVTVDGWPLTSRAGSESTNDVRVGSRAIVARDPLALFHIATRTATVHAAQRTAVRLVLQPKPREGQYIRQSARWGGVVLATVGAGFVVHALTRSGPDAGRTAICEPACSDVKFRRLGPVLEAPLGYSLMMTGGTWTVGSLVEGQEEDVPVWSLLGGALVGALAYGLSAALD